MSFSVESTFLRYPPTEFPPPKREEQQEGNRIQLHSPPGIFFKSDKPATQQSSFHLIPSMTTETLVTWRTLTWHKRPVLTEVEFEAPFTSHRMFGVYQRVMDELRKRSAEQTESRVREPFSLEVRESISPEAERHAQAVGLYGSLKVAKEAVHEVITDLRGMSIDLLLDPEAEDGDPTICLTLTVGESVDRMLELDDALQRILYDRVPVKDRPHFSFFYNFE